MVLIEEVYIHFLIFSFGTKGKVEFMLNSGKLIEEYTNKEFWRAN